MGGRLCSNDDAELSSERINDSQLRGAATSVLEGAGLAGMGGRLCSTGHISEQDKQRVCAGPEAKASFAGQFRLDVATHYSRGQGQAVKAACVRVTAKKEGRKKKERKKERKKEKRKKKVR